ncbi:hypothetical protein BTJ40_03075 [Microbulbifer sp. A4B17]|uniref:DUF4785 family immunoglobulin-like domain-containing protein n=1 Tax=Microbulbifer sp. A4B17 TaxID=359370 RepID=UPI000D52ABD6|nr:hypothetical protein [Microbulbifer sp. A4B17]AWF79881.1 hypothetical protein BTJ40_03075 [Microbulbifer sp. A4B17]
MSTSIKDRSKVRLAVWGVAVIVAGLVGYWALVGSDEVTPTVVAKAKAEERSIRSHNPDTIEPAEPEQEEEGQSVRLWKEIQSLPNKTELHESLLSDMARFHRYPPENRAIKTPEQDPITQTFAVDERTTHSEEGDSLTLWTDEKFYLRGDIIRVFAYQADSDGDRVSAELTALLVYEDQEVVGTLAFSDSDGDLIYEVLMEAGSFNGQALEAGIFKVIVDTDIDGLRDAAAFTLSEDTGSYTGSLRDSVTADGNLLIEAEVEISRDGRYYFQGSLYNDDQSPIGTTQNAFELTVGRHWVPLEFYGLLIRDAGQDGPYLVKQLSIARVTVPMARDSAFEPGYYTERYSLDQFTDIPYREL